MKNKRDRETRITELKSLNRRRLNIKAKCLGLKPTGSKTNLIEKIYEIETAPRSRRIDEMFRKITSPNQKITNDNTNKVNDNIVNKKRMRDDEDDSLVSRKIPKTK